MRFGSAFNSGDALPVGGESATRARIEDNKRHKTAAKTKGTSLLYATPSRRPTLPFGQGYRI